MDLFLFWLVVVLLLISVFSWPTWPYTDERWVYRRGGGWRYAPSGASAGAAVLILLLFWLGLLAITLPWATVPATAPTAPVVVD